MDTITLDTLELMRDMPGLGVAFPLHSGTGAASTSCVYFEVDPGAGVGIHQDSAEELLVIIEGEAEARVGEDRSRLTKGQLGLVPAMVAHDVVNVGGDVLRVLGVFSSATVVHTFAEAPEPGAPQVFVTGAPVEMAAPLSQAPLPTG